MAAVLALVLAQAPLAMGPVYSSPSLRPTGPSLAFFEVANATGTGMGSACACTAVTGAKGETLTWTRGSSAMCLKKGLATTGIANGDAVSCASNLPRVESDGTALGLLVEESRTNKLLRSSELDDAAWSIASGGGASNPTITANYGTAPDGTLTADRVQIPGCAPAGSYSLVLQSYTGTAASWATSMFIKGVSGSGTIILISLDATLVSGLFVSCSYNASTWTWCGGPSAPLVKTFANASSRVYFGCDNGSGAVTGTSDTGAADVLVWNVQAEAGTFPTNPIVTTSAAVTRAADSNAVDGTNFPTSFSLSAYITTEYSNVSAAYYYGIVEGQIGNASGVGFFLIGNAPRLQTLNGSSANVTSNALTFAAGSTHKLTGVNSGGISTIYFDGATVAGPTATNTPAAPWRTTTGVGVAPVFPGPLAGIISRVCLDASPTRCAP